MFSVLVDTGLLAVVARRTDLGGNPGVTTRDYEVEIHSGSPFHYGRLSDPSYLLNEGSVTCDLVTETRFEDYAWLFLKVHNYDYLILHKWTWDGSPTPTSLAKIATVWPAASSRGRGHGRRRPPAP